MGDAGFQKFLEILRSGNREAVDRLLADFDPFLRRAIRLRLLDGRARRAVDTADILQSLLKDFLNREGAGSVATSSSRFRAYLMAAAHYKIAAKVRKERRRIADLHEIPEPQSHDPPPGQRAEERDLIEAICLRLDAGDRRLLDLSRQGRTWRQIAEEIGGHPDTLRIQLRRSVAAALSEIRLGDSLHAG
jgi:RNA polymerase sigma factor (sigma-70 family)